MKRNLTLILLTLTLTSCFFSDYKSELIKAPTGNFEIKATVNLNDKNSLSKLSIKKYSQE